MQVQMIRDYDRSTRYHTGVVLNGDSRRIASLDIEKDCLRDLGDGKSYAWVWSVYVDEQLRGKKVGELLMIYGLLEAYRLGETSVGLYVHSTNPSARRLYEKIGFEYVSTTPILSGGWIPTGDPETDPERFWMEGYYAEVCPVPWYNETYEWTMSMRIQLTPEKIRELKQRKRELRKMMLSL